jgi:glyoxylase-like metal-dependent hydrolase (beta-lactamase superfamily II)
MVDEEVTMVEQILPDIFRIEIPLPRSPLKALNAYLFKGRERFLLIDTGFNQQECLGAMLSGLDELKVDLNKTDFFITHLHADHLGLVEKLIRRNSLVYFGEVEASVSASIRKRPEERYAQLFSMFLTYGFPEAELRSAMASHPGLRYGPSLELHFHTLREGDIIEVGDYSLQCIQTPGHSPGHMCLYEERAKILISGDHILFDITPNITRWPEMENSLGEYLTSLEKIYALDVELVLPGHRRVMNNHRKRIQELLEHHKRRLDEVLHALESGEKTVWDVAPFLSWDIDFPSWEGFPPAQKWFALGETIAHLQYLKHDGIVIDREYKGRMLFSLRSPKVGKRNGRQNSGKS